jgi:hypothetical protein
VERQLRAEGDLCAAIYELMVGHRYSVFEVRDAVDLLTGELYGSADRLRRMANRTPSLDHLAALAFGNRPQELLG